MSQKYKIVFMGTPRFSVPGLQALHQNGYEIVMVVTQPDRPRGRGRRMMPSPVKQTALDLGYPFIQPVSLTKPEYLFEMDAIGVVSRDKPGRR